MIQNFTVFVIYLIFFTLRLFSMLFEHLNATSENKNLLGTPKLKLERVLSDDIGYHAYFHSKESRSSLFDDLGDETPKSPLSSLITNITNGSFTSDTTNESTKSLSIYETLDHYYEISKLI